LATENLQDDDVDISPKKESVLAGMMDSLGEQKRSQAVVEDDPQRTKNPK
jgi:hypothetical protein